MRHRSGVKATALRAQTIGNNDTAFGPIGVLRDLGDGNGGRIVRGLGIGDAQLDTRGVARPYEGHQIPVQTPRKSQVLDSSGALEAYRRSDSRLTIAAHRHRGEVDGVPLAARGPDDVLKGAHLPLRDTGLVDAGRRGDGRILGQPGPGKP